ncbi:MAG: aspartate--ammonia ligase [Bacilli bacterium]|jgi:aspartate--ammonia ligase|nr:aspartate--ammonia ligase [Bacilli bacterium]
MAKLIFPKGYVSALDLYGTQKAIKTIKDFFQVEFAVSLNLRRVSAPLFVDPTTGLNDNLNGVERPVSFDIKDIPGVQGEVVQSLAKWKRYALGKYDFKVHKGLYTDMNAIRRDEELDNIHSLYVDQWDWEKVIEKKDRTLTYLEETVKDIYASIVKTEKYLSIQYDYINEILPEDIFFITSEDLLKKYPKANPKEREYRICKEKKAVFIEKIGAKLSNGLPHDGRAPDYDDWSLNGDILVYDPLLDIALELSSMGIRVDRTSLASQLKEAGCLERTKLPFQKAILEDKLPLTIGGGIGQSRLCMFFLRKAHIGEVQSSLWPDKMVKECQEHGIFLL